MHTEHVQPALVGLGGGLTPAADQSNVMAGGAVGAGATGMAAGVAELAPGRGESHT